MMKRKRVVCSALAFSFVLTVLLGSAAWAAGTGDASAANALLTLGNVGQDAANLKVWTDPPADKGLKPGGNMAVSFKSDKDCYVVVVNVSPKGSVTVVFPNNEQRDNKITAGRDYTIFGPESKIRLVMGKSVQEAKLAFFVSPKPINLDEFKIPEGDIVFRIPAGSGDRLDAFRATLEQAARMPGFNRVVLSIKSGEGGEPEVTMMGGRLKRGVPGQLDSEAPESITGTAGRKEDLQKE